MQFNYFHKMIYFRPLKNWRVVRVAEGARLESVYMPKVYREFESLTLRQKIRARTKSVSDAYSL